jgi:phospholipid/cholesterol/gamma-HCH transport system ATP-binding protein
VPGVEVGIKNLSKSFGSSNIWSDVTLTLPAGEISALLGPSGTGKSVLLKSIIGLLKPEKGSIFIRDTDLVRCSERGSTRSASCSGCSSRTARCSGR